MKRRVRWDEANLNRINTNKPVRKKIDEPKTPYHPILLGEDGSSSPQWDPSDSISYAAHAEAARIALNKLALTQNLSMKSGEAMDREEGSVEKFEEHRRAHYDEFKKMKELKRKGPFLEDHEDLDDYSHSQRTGLMKYVFKVIMKFSKH